MNTRSPKDARILSPEMFDAIRQDKEQLEKEVNLLVHQVLLNKKGGTVDDNAVLRFCYVNFVKKMVVTSGKEAVQLLADR